MRRSHCFLSLVLSLTCVLALVSTEQSTAQEAAVQLKVQVAAQPIPQVESVDEVHDAAEEVEDAAETGTETDTAAEPESSEPALPPGTMRFHLMDGSVFTGTLAVKTIPIKTEFGDLVVPIESIKRLAPGLQSHPKLDQQIKSLIEQLGHPDAGRRDAAQGQLVSYGSGLIRLLRQYTDDADAERKLRVKAVIETLYEQQMSGMNVAESAKPSASLVELDEIETEAFTMAGQITKDEFEIQSKFGSLNVTLSDIMAVEKITSTKPEVRRTIEVSGNDFAGMKWKNSGIRVNRGDRIIIMAEGQIVMSPWGRNTVSGPDGMPNNGMYNGNIPFGALVGKIGSGPEMLLGSSKNFVATNSGVLNLGFAMQSNWANQNFPGTYDVKIRVIPAGGE